MKRENVTISKMTVSILKRSAIFLGRRALVLPGCIKQICQNVPSLLPSVAVKGRSDSRFEHLVVSVQEVRDGEDFCVRAAKMSPCAQAVSVA